MEPVQAQLPTSFYYIIGVLVVANLGTIVSMVYAIVKAVWFFSKMDSRIDTAKDMAIRSHKRLDKLEERLQD